MLTYNTKPDRITLSLAVLCIAFVVAGCKTSVQVEPVTVHTNASKAPSRPAHINHMVFVKMKSQADAREIIADGDRLLRPIPGVVSYFAGPRLETGRANVDSSFDVGFYLGFNTVEDYDRYSNHPSHVEALAKWKPRWESARIVDVIDDTP